MCPVGLLCANAEVGVLFKPTFKDVHYSGKYERSVMDIWLTDSQGPAPVLVYFHGGGFKGGDKKKCMTKKFITMFLIWV